MAVNIALYSFCSIFFIISISTVTTAAAAAPSANIKHVYIVYLRKSSNEGPKAQHLSILRKVVGSEAERRLIYNYHSFNAFSARLTDKEREKLSKLDEVAFVTEDREYRLEPHQQVPKDVPRPAHQHTPKYGFDLRPILP